MYHMSNAKSKPMFKLTHCVLWPPEHDAWPPPSDSPSPDPVLRELMMMIDPGLRVHHHQFPVLLPGPGGACVRAQGSKKSQAVELGGSGFIASAKASAASLCQPGREWA